jgi:hypothetical protein
MADSDGLQLSVPDPDSADPSSADPSSANPSSADPTSDEKNDASSDGKNDASSDSNDPKNDDNSADPSSADPSSADPTSDEKNDASSDKKNDASSDSINDPKDNDDSKSDEDDVPDPKNDDDSYKSSDEDDAAEWDQFDLPSSVSISLDEHTGTTELYTQHIATLSPTDTLPFDDGVEAFSRCLELAELILAGNLNMDILDAWTGILKACLDGTSRLAIQNSKKVIVTAISLVRTSPEVFGDNFELQLANQKAVFQFQPLAHDHIKCTDACQRHDLVLWIASLHLLGKAFELEGWPSTLHAETLVEEPLADQHVIRIVHGSESVLVTRDAMDAMGDALDSMASQPGPFFKSKYAVIAVTKILNRDLLAYAMPQTEADLTAFDWEGVVPGRYDTYPKAPQPAQSDFDLVHAVHSEVKKGKDARAQAVGLVKSGVQAYNTYKQKWKYFRDFMAVYRHLHAGESLPFVDNMATFRLKLCKSQEAMEAAMTQDVRKFLLKRRTKILAAEKVARIAAEESQAAEKAELLRAEVARLAEERGRLEAMKIGNPDREARAEKRKSMLKQQKAVEEAQKKAKEANEERKEKAKQKRNAERQRNEVEADDEEEPSKKKTRRNDVARLDEVTPRQKAANLGNAWSPPSRSDSHVVLYAKPGSKWENASVKKLHLLSSLRHHLKAVNLLAQPMGFGTLMEFIEPEASSDTESLTFDQRVFLYLMALVLKQKRFVASTWLSFELPNMSTYSLPLLSTFDDVVGVMLAFVVAKLITPAAVAMHGEARLQAIIVRFDVDRSLGGAIHAVASELVKEPYAGIVPRTRDGLKDLPIHSDVTTLLLQHVYGESSEFVVGLHARKILIALDMVDWEETGHEKKVDIKMLNLPANRVKKSLLTWLPLGEKAAFHDLMDSLGSILSPIKSVGVWGRVTATINGNFAQKDKKALTEMVENISQFYRATVSGGNKTH